VELITAIYKSIQNGWIQNFSITQNQTRKCT
jgi:hypothetical protein